MVTFTSQWVLLRLSTHLLLLLATVLHRRVDSCVFVSRGYSFAIVIWADEVGQGRDSMVENEKEACWRALDV